MKIPKLTKKYWYSDKKCGICGGQIENVENPHFHIIDGETVRAIDTLENGVKRAINRNETIIKS